MKVQQGQVERSDSERERTVTWLILGPKSRALDLNFEV
jgi:hypothetical protein